MSNLYVWGANAMVVGANSAGYANIAAATYGELHQLGCEVARRVGLQCVALAC